LLSGAKRARRNAIETQILILVPNATRGRHGMSIKAADILRCTLFRAYLTLFLHISAVAQGLSPFSWSQGRAEAQQISFKPHQGAWCGSAHRLAGNFDSRSSGFHVRLIACRSPLGRMEEGEKKSCGLQAVGLPAHTFLSFICLFSTLQEDVPHRLQSVATLASVSVGFPMLMYRCNCRTGQPSRMALPTPSSSSKRSRNMSPGTRTGVRRRERSGE
jgi:hypothetical protein